jgi:hypothetical protein
MGRSIAAVLAGYVTALVPMFLSQFGIDYLFYGHSPLTPAEEGEAASSAAMALTALAVAVLATAAGGLVTARLARSAPARHAMVVGGGVAVLALTAVMAAARQGYVPFWLPLTMAVLAVPAAVLGARLAHRPARPAAA